MTNARRPAFVDSSVLLRYFTGDDAEKAERCRDLLENAGAGNFELHVSHLLFAESAWTMRSFFGLSRQSIAERLADLATLRSIKIHERDLIGDAVETYARNNVNFVDAYFAAEMKRHGIRSIYSYDKDFDKLGVRRVEP